MYLCSQNIVTRTFTLVLLVDNWKVLIFSFKLFAEKIINFAMLGEQIVKIPMSGLERIFIDFFQTILWYNLIFIVFGRNEYC